MYTPSAALAQSAPPIPRWPGRLVPVGAAEVFVRSAPSPPGAEPGLCVHGLGGSSTNWTDLMDLLRRAAAGRTSGADGQDAGWPGRAPDRLRCPGPARQRVLAAPA